MSFSIAEISRTPTTVRYGLFLDPSLDPGSDGIESFEAQLDFDINQATYVDGSLSYPVDFIGLTNEDNADIGVLVTGGFSLTPFTSFEEPLISFELDVSTLVGPGDISVNSIYIDGINQPDVNLIYTPFPNTDPEGSVTISGTASVGEELSASNNLTDADGLGPISYQWYADGDSIDGATNTTYHPSLADKGKAITVVASYTDGQAYPEMISSAATEPVNDPGDLIEGTAGPDTLAGGDKDDTVVGFEGRDILRGNGGDDELRGDEDIDTAVYDGDLVDYTLLRTNNEIQVSGPAANGNDLLIDIERVQFNDLSLAFDLDGNAGLVAKLLGVMLGKDNWYVREFVGIGLDILDNSNITYEALMDIALDEVMAINGQTRTNQSVFTLIYQNVVGAAPSQGEINQYVGLLENGTYTQASLAVAAAEYFLNEQNIGLVGLTELGLEFV